MDMPSMELIFVCLLSRSFSVFLLFPAGKISIGDRYFFGRKMCVMYQGSHMARHRCATILLRDSVDGSDSMVVSRTNTCLPGAQGEFLVGSL